MSFIFSHNMKTLHFLRFRNILLKFQDCSHNSPRREHRSSKPLWKAICCCILFDNIFRSLLYSFCHRNLETNLKLNVWGNCTSLIEKYPLYETACISQSIESPSSSKSLIFIFYRCISSSCLSFDHPPPSAMCLASSSLFIFIQKYYTRQADDQCKVISRGHFCGEVIFCVRRRLPSVCSSL